MAQNPLDQLYEALDGCETLAFLHLTTRTVLLKNEATPESQDALNALCVEAALVLKDGPVGLLANSDRLTLFLKSNTLPSDALCCVCAKDTDVERFLALGQTCLAELGGVG